MVAVRILRVMQGALCFAYFAVLLLLAMYGLHRSHLVLTCLRLKKKLKAAKIDNINVMHLASSRLPADSKFVICHKGMSKLVRSKAPEAVVVGFNFFFNDPVFDKVVKALVDKTEIAEEN